MRLRIVLWSLSHLPMIVLGVLAFLYIVPKQMAGFSSVMPLLPVLPLFFWGVVQPRNISVLGVAILAIPVDISTALPLGFSSFVWVLCFLLLRSQRKYIYREGFLAMWGYFGLFLCLIYAMEWFLYRFLMGVWTPLHQLGMPWLLTLLLYPMAHAFFLSWVEKIAEARYRLKHA